MKKVFIVSIVVLPLVLSAGPARPADDSVGKQAFVKHCAICHPEGRNIINAAKTLQKKALLANGIRDAADIVRNMRIPGPGMTKFDEKAIPDETAGAIAEYILKTFK